MRCRTELIAVQGFDDDPARFVPEEARTMTSTPYRPSGHKAACPYLIVSDAAATVTFLECSFGATVLSRHPNEAVRLRHAEVRIDDSIVMLADSAPGWPPMPSHVHVDVPDVDTRYARALAAGAEGVQEPVRKGDEDKCGGVKDAFCVKLLMQKYGAEPDAQASHDAACRRTLDASRDGLRRTGAGLHRGHAGLVSRFLTCGAALPTATAWTRRRGGHSCGACLP